MTPAEYAERKAKKLCLGFATCSRPRVRGARYCEPCRETVRRAHRAYAARDYMRRKIAGLCVAARCKEKVTDSVLCPVHLAACNERRRGWRQRQSAAKLAEIRERERQRREMKRETGTCRDCRKSSVFGVFCVSHHEKDRLRRQRWMRAHGSKPCTKKCGLCRKTGHRRQRCPLRFKVDITDIASSRPGAEL